MKIKYAMTSLALGMALAAGNAQAYYNDLDVASSGENLHNLIFPGAFTDYLRFSVDMLPFSLADNPGMVVTGTFKDIPDWLLGVPVLNINDLNVDLYSTTVAQCSMAHTNCTGTFMADLGTGDTINYTTPSLAAGYYFFKVTGDTTPLLGGKYSYNATAVVPEPGEWALMLSGLGLVGFMARRRAARSA